MNTTEVKSMRLNNNQIKNHIIFFSGGTASFAVAAWVKKKHPNDNILLYFTDTLWESEDLYRFNN